MNINTFTALALLLPLNLMAAALLPGDAQNGKMLHDNSSCMSCHIQMTSGKPDLLYTRDDRRISGLGGLIKQVGLCNKIQKVGLDENGVNDVVNYLNQSFYKFGD